MTSIVNELRLGNWVYRNGKFSGGSHIVAVSVDSINEWGIDLDCWHETISPDIFACHISPIPITADILEKAGFLKREDGDYEIEFGRKAFFVYLSQGSDWYLLYRYDIGCDISPLLFVEHLHQLQNIIFSISGEELPITL